MKKLTTILLMLIVLSSFGQQQYGDFVNLNMRARMYSNAFDLITAHPDSAGQFLYQNAADPEDDFGVVNVRYLEANYMASEVVDDSINIKLAREVPEYVLNLDDLFLNNGAARTVSVASAPGSGGDTLIVKGGDADDGIGGRPLILRGGGEVEQSDVVIGSGFAGASIYLKDTIRVDNVQIKGVAAGVDDDDVVVMSQIAGTSKTHSIALPNAGSVQGRVDGATVGTDYPTGWTLSAAGNNIDLLVNHNLGKRVSNVNVMTVNGDIEQLLRPFAGAYSGWQTNNANQLQINGLATTPLPIKIYISFE